MIQMKQHGYRLLLLILFLVQFGVGSILPILPAYVQSFGADSRDFGYLIMVMSGVQCSVAFTASRLLLRWGSKAVLAAGLGLFMLGQAWLATAAGMAELYASRVIAGAGLALLQPAIMAYISSVTTAEERLAGLGKSGAAMSCGMVVGPVIGGWLAGSDLRLPLWGGTLLLFLAWLAVCFYLPLPGGAQAVAGRQERLAPEPRPAWRRQPLLLLVFLLAFSLGQVETVFGLYAMELHGCTPQELGWLMMAAALGGAVVQGFFLRPLQRLWREKILVRSGLLLCSTIVLSYCFIRGFWLLLMAVVAFLAVVLCVQAALAALVSRQHSDRPHAAAAGYAVCNSLGLVLGPGVGGFLFALDWRLPFLCAAVLLSGAAVYRRLWHELAASGCEAA